MALSAKALSLAQTLQSNLAQRLPALTSVLSQDSSGNPVITVGTNVAGSPGCVARVIALSYPLVTDSLGNAQTVYTPSVIQVAFEAEAAAQASWINSVSNRTQIMTELTLKGTEVQVYHSTNGTAPSVSVMTGTPDADVQPNVAYPTLSNQ